MLTQIGTFPMWIEWVIGLGQALVWVLVVGGTLFGMIRYAVKTQRGED